VAIHFSGVGKECHGITDPPSGFVFDRIYPLNPTTNQYTTILQHTILIWWNFKMSQIHSISWTIVTICIIIPLIIAYYINLNTTYHIVIIGIGTLISICTGKYIDRKRNNSKHNSDNQQDGDVL